MDILEIKNVTYNYSNSNEKVLYSVNQKFNITFIISRFR